MLKDKVIELETEFATSQSQKETQDNTIISLEDEIISLKTNLTAARDLLKSSAVPKTELEQRALRLSRQNEKLRSRLQKVEKQASGEITKTREMALSNQTKATMTQNQTLKMRCNELESLLRRKEEELHEHYHQS